MARECVAAIVQKHGLSNVVVVAHFRVADYWRGWPGLSVLTLDLSKGRLAGSAQMIRALKKIGPAGVGYLLTPSFSSAAIFAFAGVEKRVGFAGNIRGALLSDPVTRPRDHRSRHYSDTLKSLVDSTSRSGNSTPPAFHWPAEARLRVETYLMNAGLADSRFVVVAMGALGINRNYPLDAWHQAIRQIMRHISVVLVGTRNDRGLRSLAGLEISSRLFDWCGMTSVPELAILLGQAAGFAGSDSGAAHLAASMDCPTVVMFGAGDEATTRPLGISVKVLRAPLWCAPCRVRTCHRTDRPLECLHLIRADEVASSLLAASGRE